MICVNSLPVQNFRKSILFPLILSVGFITGCSTAPEKQYQDPLESMNRKIFAFNEGFDEFLLMPATKGYKAITPGPVEQGLRNAFANLLYPRVFMSDFLQGNFGPGLEGVSRFVMNSTFGLAGLIDVSKGMGLDKKENDFGQVFAQWGFGSGPYLVAPILGSYTMRHGLGDIAATPTNPSFYIDNSTAKWAIRGGILLDFSAQMMEQRKMVSGDKYLFMRDAYLQNRKFLIEGDSASNGDDPFLDGY